jgi:hypothetical protein
MTEEPLTQAQQDRRELRGLAQTGAGGFDYVGWPSPDVHQLLDDGYYGFFPPAAPPAPPLIPAHLQRKKKSNRGRKKKPTWVDQKPIEIVCAICDEKSYKRPRRGQSGRVYKLCSECATAWNGKLIPYEAEQKLLGRRP